MQCSDAELVEAARAGDIDSFRKLYERYYGLAVGIARSRLADQHLAEDAAQETFATACRWLDARTKKLVRLYDPGADGFNVDTQADRDNPAEAEYSKGTLLGSMMGDIVLDARLDPKLFDLTPPEGFEIVVQPPRPTVTEAEMIEWLGAAARFNNGTFFDTDRGLDLERYNEIATKDQANRTEVEQKLFDLQFRHLINGNSPVMASFANEYTAGGRFRYLVQGSSWGVPTESSCSTN